MKVKVLKPALLLLFCSFTFHTFAQNLSLGLNGDGSILVGNKPEYNITGSFTIEAKALIDTTNLNTNPRIISKGNVHFGFTGFMLFYMWASANANNPKGYYFSFCCNPSNVEVQTSEVSYCEFNHIAVSYDSTASKVWIYVNGIAMDSASISSPLKLNTKDVRIGMGDGGDYWFGKLDEMRIWNHPRTTSELISLMNDTLSPAYYTSSDSGLIGYWRMDQVEDLGSGAAGTNDMRDYSPSGNHGEMEGNAGLVNDSTGCPAPMVGLVENQKINHISVYPNPFTSTVFIKSSSKMLECAFYDLPGKKIMSIQPLSSECEINKAGLLPGIYFLKISTNDYTVTKKIILQ